MKFRFKVSDLIFTIFSALWLLVIVGDYINKHPFYKFSYLYFRFQNLILFVLAFSLGLSAAIFYWPKFKRWISTGLGLSFIILIFLTALALSFSEYMPGLDLKAHHVGSFLTINIAALGFLVWLVISAYLYGKIIKLPFLNLAIYNIGLGIFAICSLLFFLAAINQYNQYTAIAVLILPFLFHIRRLPKLLYNILFKEIELKGLSIWGSAVLCFTLFFLCMNFAHLHAPFPVGFDSRNFYMNIARQVSLSEGLIYGFRPYNWSLLISLAYALFGSSSLAVSVSFLGFILSAVAIFHLGTKAFKINLNNVLLGLLILTVTPAITNQLYIELKTDMGLLFFQCLAVLFFVRTMLSKGFNKILKSDDRLALNPFKLTGNISKIVVLGLFLGFGLSIKLTNMFLVFAMVICLFWIISENKWVISAIVFVTILVFMLAGLDKLTGLHEYHLGRTALIVALSIISLITVTISFLKAKIKVVNGVIITTALALFTAVPLLPWMVKNYNDTKSFHPSSLLNGAAAGAKVNLNSLHTNYIKSLEE